MVNKIVSALGSALVLFGLAVLAYIGVTYAQSVRDRPQTHTWSIAQLATGRRIQSSLAGTQRVAVPRALRVHKIVPGGEPGLRMVIPKLHLDAPIVQTPPIGGVWDVADWAVGHLTTTPNPGAPGNAGYAAHDDIKGELFKRLGDLVPGNKILLYTRHAVYRYVVVGQQVVDPSNVSVLNPTRTSTITLISCTPYWVDTQRLVVQAVLKSSAAV